MPIYDHTNYISKDVPIPELTDEMYKVFKDREKSRRKKERIPSTWQIFLRVFTHYLPGPNQCFFTVVVTSLSACGVMELFSINYQPVPILGWGIVASYVFILLINGATDSRGD